MTFIPKAQQIYKHFKGNQYQIVALATHTETGEELVIYQALYGEFKIFARPLSMFAEKVDKEKYKDANQEYRFELVNGVDERLLEGAPTPSTKIGEENTVKAEEPIINNTEETQELNLDPMVIAYLDAESYEEKLNILVGLHHRITHDMITVMAVASDVEVPEGELEDRFIGLKNCLITLEKYECNRLR